MKYKTMFKVDFKEARENAGLEVGVVEKIAKGIGYDVNVSAIENSIIKPSEKEATLLMSIYGQHNEDKGMRF